MRNLRLLDNPHDPAELAELLDTITIFEKIDFSNISKDQIRAKIHHLRTEQVPNRTVLLDMNDEAVVEYWFKNWLHCDLKHWVKAPPKDSTGCSAEVRMKDTRRAMLRFYENGQQNYQYTLADIEEWLESDEKQPETA